MTSALSAVAALPLVGWSVHAAALRHRLTLARRDPLTGLPTRDQFTDRATRLLRARSAPVVLIDLDRFKPLNDTHGHAAGDDALRAVAERLTAWIGRSGIAARLGSDEFAAILLAPADPGQELTDLHYSLTRPVAARPSNWSSAPRSASTSPRLASPYPQPCVLLTPRCTPLNATVAAGTCPARTGLPKTKLRARWRRHRPAAVR